ncbi:MAG: presenilin family intramembrane aspartyl protease [Dehalococcoidales bacterium]|nr:presenilin family intramembrane aspartyl protease [Dehalococcoidales bacterium]
MTEKQPATRKVSLQPILWSSFLYIIGLLLVFAYLYPGVQEYIESSQIPTPEVSILPILAYFFGMVVVIGVVLFLIPVSKLKYVFRALFGLLYAWGIFIILSLILPPPAAIGIGAALGLLWLFRPFIWLQNLLLLLTLASVGAVFGAVVSPWTLVWVLLAISIYDIVAVSLGYMMWMAKKLSETDTLPAFILPRRLRDWKLNLKGAGFQKLFETESAERDFSLLGGGDIGFPLIFVASVFFTYSMSGALIVSAGSLAGIIFAYILQIWVLKGKPLPALPPISFLAIVSFLVVYFFL